MKTFLIVLCVICIIVPLIVYGAAIVKSVQMEANCIGYLKMAADANNVELANKHLTSALNYLEANNLTRGNTKFLIYRPTNDLGLWYENLKSAQKQLTECSSRDDLTELEESNMLMKLRETLCDNDGSINHPSMISFYPDHVSWTLAVSLIWLLWAAALFSGMYAYDMY